MATDLEQKAREAFVDDNFDLSVELYSLALDSDPGNADLFADRAQANIKLCNFTEAVDDASRAIELDPSLAKAYLRKGIACMELEEYQTAKAAFEAGISLASGDSRFAKLLKECNECIADIANKSKEISGVKLDVSSESADLAPKKPKYRHYYYNSPTEVVLTIFAKGVPADNVVIDFGEQILSVTIDIPGEEPYHFQLCLSRKISGDEICLTKAETVTWPSLEFSKDKVAPQKMQISSALNDQWPSYPSSKAKIDWNKLEAQVKKEEKEEKLSGDAALNKLFQDIYRDADEDTRRAMSKSFVESNGTVLSTNWREVGSKKVDGSPPEEWR